METIGVVRIEQPEEDQEVDSLSQKDLICLL